ncbi:MAG: ETC complex I subunit [Wolbachia endosymbiont of Fragariocoptes setiger]|nr:ETC complex I subunit [Wolbachia endosymbiont of Fragariocoptes setiger]
MFKIYKPTKTAMQSGLGKTKDWHLECDSSSNLFYIDPLMGWIGSKDSTKHIILKFDSLEKAISYAKKCKIPYRIETPKYCKKLPKRYTSQL